MATQKGRNWSSGDIVTAANLSSIERGVSAVAEEYTPTTWANGNTVTAAGLNNIEQGIANASGGGSSDFSTAQVTVVNTIDDATGLFFGAVTTNDSVSGRPSAPVGTTVNTAILHDGSSLWYVTYSDLYDVLTVSGNITKDGDNILSITGDCTITIS